MLARTTLISTFILLAGSVVKEVDLAGEIPSATDDAFIKFQRAVSSKQDELSTPVVFSNLAAYKIAFESFLKDSKVKIDQLTNVDTNFAKFQRFMAKYMKEYKSFKELSMRYDLFLNTLRNMGGYYDGGDGLAGINSLSDKTLKEKQDLYG